MNATEALALTLTNTNVTSLYNETMSKIKQMAEEGKHELILSTVILGNHSFRVVQHRLEQEGYNVDYFTRTTGPVQDTIVISWLPASPFPFPIRRN